MFYTYLNFLFFIFNFLCVILKLYMLKMTQKYIYFFEKLFIIWYMIGIDNIAIK